MAHSHVICNLLLQNNISCNSKFFVKVFFFFVEMFVKDILQT